MHRYIANVAEQSLLHRATVALMGTPRRASILLLIAFLAGLVGPFGTTAGFFSAERYVYWLLVTLGSAIPVQAVFMGFDRFMGHSFWRDATWLPIISLVASIPATSVVILIATLFGSRIDAPTATELYGQCAFVVLAIATIMHLATSQSRRKPAADLPVQQALAKESSPPILDRLPGARRGKLLRISAQDHYVEVVTDRGWSLVAMRFRDAIADARPVNGAQIHRSHWVAADAVTARRSVNGAIRLELSDGSVVPVGRTFRRAAKMANVLY